MARILSLLMLLALGPGLGGALAAAPPARPMPSPPAAQAMPDAASAHPRLLLRSTRLAQIRQMAQAPSSQWVRLLAWAESPSRQERNPQDAPGLALAALVSKDFMPEQARRLARLALECTQAAAPHGRVQSVARNQITDAQRMGKAEKLKGSSYTLLNSAAVADKPWRVMHHTSTGLTTNPADPPLVPDFKQGDVYLLLADDLAEAARLAGLVAYTLDWGWDFYTDQERRDLAAWLVAQAMVFGDRSPGCFDLASTQLLRLVALAGLAAEGLHPRADELARQARQVYFQQGFLPCLRGAGAGGAWFGGSGAGALAGWYLVEFEALWNSATGEDPGLGVPWFDDRLTYLVQHVLPGLAVSPRGGYRRLAPDGDQLLPAEEMSDLTRLQSLVLLSLRPQDKSAGFAWVRLLDPAAPRVLNEHWLYHELLWYDPDPRLQPLSEAPLLIVAPAAGRAMLRADWSDLGTWLGFNCGPHFAEPQHLDAGSLVIYRQGMLLPPGGAYDGPVSQHALNYAIRSLAQNTIQIYDHEEYSWYDMREGPQKRGFYANDGGQRAWALFDQQGRPTAQAPWTASGWDSGPAPWSQLGEIYQVAGIEAWDNQKSFAYVRGQATRAYQGSTGKASRVVRHVFHLRPGGTDDSESREVVAVVDDIVLERENAIVRFVLHSQERPEVQAQMTSPGPGRAQGEGKRLRLTAGPSRLEIIDLVPGGSRIRLFGVAGTADAWVGDHNYPARPPAVNPAPWRTDMEPLDQKGRVRPLVHALLPDDAGSPEPPPVAALNSPEPNVVGMVISDRSWPRVLAVRLGNPQEEAAVSYDYPVGPTRHLVAGLWPERNYQVKVDGGRVTLTPGQGQGLKSSKAGSLVFMVPAPAGVGGGK